MTEFEHSIYTKGEPLLSEKEQQELNELRRKQIQSVDGLSDEEEERLLELLKKRPQHWRQEKPLSP